MKKLMSPTNILLPNLVMKALYLTILFFVSKKVTIGASGLEVPALLNEVAEFATISTLPFLESFLQGLL